MIARPLHAARSPHRRAGAFALAVLASAACAVAAWRAPEVPKVFPVDPVALVGGAEQKGDAAFTVDRFGFRYTFTSAANRDAFNADPARYEVQFGGACAKMGPLSGDGSPDRYTVHNGRIYLFASDSCRATFLKDPSVRMDDPDPRPEPTAAQAEAGRALLDRAVTAMGGAERVDAVSSFTRSLAWEEQQGQTLYKRRDVLQVAFPDRVRHDDVWNDDVYGTVAGPRGGYFTGSSVRLLHPFRTGALVRLVRHDPLVIVRSRGLEGFVVMDTGPSEVEGVTTSTVQTWIDGSATTLHVDGEGQIIAAQYRGRGPDQTVGTVLKRFTGWQSVDGVNLPTGLQVTFNGQRVPAADKTGWTWTINPVLSPDTFEPAMAVAGETKGH